MPSPDDLLARIRAYCLETGTSRSRFGIAICNDAKMLSRLEAGRITLRTYQRILAFLDAAQRPTSSPQSEN